MRERRELAPGLIVEIYDEPRLAWTRALRLRAVHVVARLLRVPITIRDEFYGPSAAVGYCAPTEGSDDA